MRIPLYHVDAFAERPFEGNPAAVCVLDAPLDEATMQAIAAENNLSETAFLRGRDGVYDLKWYTRECEAMLCGHATLAAAYVVFAYYETGLAEVSFTTNSGPLSVRRDGDLLAMNFPARPSRPIAAPDGLAWCIGAEPLEVRRSTGEGDWLIRLADAATVRDVKPDFNALATLPFRGVTVTAAGEGDVDFVSRYFAPALGLDEDPVTGSSHCTLVPYWAERLGKDTFVARQLSARGGTLRCRLLDGERVELAGRAVPVVEGTMTL